MIARAQIQARAAFLAFHDGPQLARRTRQRFLHDLSRWEKIVGELPIDSITEETFALFRARFGGQARTAESTIDSVLTILRSCPAHMVPSVPDAGKRLRRPTPQPKIPSLDQLDGMIRCASAATYPRFMAVEFWRAFLSVVYFTALRLDDVLHLEWSSVREDAIWWAASKTGKVHTFPMHAALRRAIDALPRWHERLFAIHPKSVRWQLRRFARAAGVTVALPQAIRRLSAMRHELAHPGAGRIILGHGLPGATAFYLDGYTILQSASVRVAVPPSLLTESERQDQERREVSLLDRWRAMSPRDRETVERLIESLAR